MFAQINWIVQDSCHAWGIISQYIFLTAFFVCFVYLLCNMHNRYTDYLERGFSLV